MHDLFEGVVKLELKLFLAYCINEKRFTLNELNQRICSYDFKESKPSLIELKPHNECKIRQSASQMISLSKAFPMLIDDKIPLDHKHYYSFLLLLKICDIVLSPCVNPDTIPYLGILIEEKILIFNQLYPSSFIPKLHYMLHYPSQIERYGPLVHTWTMSKRPN